MSLDQDAKQRTTITTTAFIIGAILISIVCATLIITGILANIPSLWIFGIIATIASTYLLFSSWKYYRRLRADWIKRYKQFKWEDYQQ